MDRSVVFLDLKGGCAPCDKPLMLRPILFCPVLTWVAQELTACGAQRFFIVCDEAWQDEVREAMEDFDTRLFASAQEALAAAEGGGHGGTPPPGCPPPRGGLWPMQRVRSSWSPAPWCRCTARRTAAAYTPPRSGR